VTEADPGDRAIPPYEGRKERADVVTGPDGGEADTERDGAQIGGADRPRQNSETKSPDPAATERGEHASPADEQPAASAPQGEPADEGTGPAHEPGVKRAEDVPDEPRG